MEGLGLLLKRRRLKPVCPRLVLRSAGARSDSKQSSRVTHTLQMTDQCGMHTAFGKPVVPELKERRASFVFWSSAFSWNLGGRGCFLDAATRSSRAGRPSAVLPTFVADAVALCIKTTSFDEIFDFSHACTVATAASGWTRIALIGWCS